MIQRTLFAELIESVAAPPANETELIEQIFSSPDVDREAGIIRGVKLLGRTSRNNREYTDRAMTESAALCEGVRVYVDHDRSGKDRKVSDFFAEIKDVRTKEDGNYADLHFLKSHALAESVLERADRFAGSFGMSPHQFGPTVTKGGKQIVESVAHIRSVDIVDTPATTNSLFESEDNPVSVNLKKFVNDIPEGTDGRAGLVELLEQDGMEELAVEAPPEDAGPDDQVKAAFRAMVVAAFDDETLDTTATIARIKDILKSQEKLQAKPEPTPEAEAEAGDEAGAEEETMESLKAENERLKAENECRELLESVGVSSTAVRLKALRPLSGDERTELVEGWKTEPAAKSNGKPKGSPPKHEPAGSTSWKTHDEFISTIKR